MNLTGRQMRLYAVTDRAWAADTDALFCQIEDAIDGGAAVVQLREKRLDEDAFLEEAKRFAALCRRKGAVSIINDHVEIAQRSGADGVHIGQEDLEAGCVRRILGPDKIVGVSAHSVEEALRAQAAGASYHYRGGGDPRGSHRRHWPGKYFGAEGLRFGWGGGGVRPVCPAGCESRGGGTAAAFGRDCEGGLNSENGTDHCRNRP